MRHPIPPFNADTAVQKVRMAEDMWNSLQPDKVALAYTEDSQWRNRDQFLHGRDEIVTFLTEKWRTEHEYRLIKELFAYTDNRIAVRYAYEFHDERGEWYRAYGNENWDFDGNGLMHRRFASINNLKIKEVDRLFHWQPGFRPASHPGLSELGL